MLAVAERRGSRYRGQNGGDSSADEAGDTVIRIERKADDDSVLELQSANEHRDHWPSPSLVLAREKRGE